MSDGVSIWPDLFNAISFAFQLQYKLHLFETASGLKFVLLTDLNVGNIRDSLQSIYR